MVWIRLWRVKSWCRPTTPCGGCAGALIDVLSPVLDDNDQVIGLVRVSYQSAALFDLLSKLRGLIIWVLVLGLGLGALLGLGLALNLSRPNSARHACHV